MAVLLRLEQRGDDLVFGVGEVETTLDPHLAAELRILAEADEAELTEEDLDRTDAGEDEGFRLAELLRGTAPWEELARLDDQTPLIVVCPEKLELLAWERLFLDETAPAEVQRRVVIGRLTPGTAEPTRPEGAFHVLHWCPTPNDQGCRRITGRLGELAPSLEIPLDEFENHIPSEPFVLHLVMSGGRYDALEPHLERGTEGRLGLALSRCEAVVLAIIGSPVGKAVALGEQLIELGAPSVIAPWGEVDVEALQRFGDGFYQALASHAPLAGAVAEGRRKVRAWGQRHPEARWSKWSWRVATLEAADSPPLRSETWRPEGWPRPASDAARLLDRARELSSAQGGGYLGVEHIVAALKQVDGGGKTTAQIRATLPRLDQFEATLAALSPQAGDEQLALSPRLAAWPGGLNDGFHLDDLCAVLAMDLAATLSGVRPGTGQPAETLTVLGGPEDGRSLEMQPAETLGRASDNDGPTHPLYAGTRLTDRKLSRQHLTWLGAGRIEVKRAARRFRAGAIARVGPGEVELEAGDLLVLTHATRVIAG